ncbi:hypothetical protein EN35_06415 [Rhodococcus qingshengii]|nr:hypothetical protein EN35_06415 [Rhodococcus qingshengii]
MAEKTPQDDDASAPLGGAVDWSLAAKAGIKLARGGPAMSRYTAETATAELAEASERAELPVREVTGLADGLPVPAADVLDRAGWITAASRSMAHLTGATLTAVAISSSESRRACRPVQCWRTCLRRSSGSTTRSPASTAPCFWSHRTSSPSNGPFG